MLDRFGEQGSRNFLDNARDTLRARLTRWNQRGLPIQELGDETPAKASVLAHLANKVPIDGGSPYELDSMKTELAGLLDQAEKFPAQYQSYMLDTAQKSARLAAMEKVVLPDAAKGQRAFKFAVDLPHVTQGPDGKFTATMQKELFDSPTEFLSELSNLRKEVDNRLRPIGIRPSPTDQPVIDQADTLKKLELYATQEFKVLTQNPTAQTDPELLALYNRIAALYKPDAPEDFQKLDPSVKALYDELQSRLGKDAPPSLLGALNGKWSGSQRLPYWAWRQEHWRELWAEIRTLYKNDAPKTQAVLDWMKKLSPEERRMLGVSDLANSLSFWGENKWFRAMTLFGTPLVGGGFSLQELGPQAYQWYFADDITKEKCAAKPKDDTFLSCMQDYLEGKFTAKQLHAMIFDKKTLIDQAGNIADPAVRREVEDAVSRRKTARQAKASGDEDAAKLKGAIQKIVTATDVGSAAYREDQIVEAPGDGPFLLSLIGADGKSGRLGTLYPGELSANSGLVNQALKDTDDKKRAADLEQLRAAGAGDMAEDLSKIFADRQKFIDGGSVKKPAASKPAKKSADDEDPDSEDQ